MLPQLVALFAALSAAPETPEPARVVHVAVTDLSVEGVEPRVARIFSSSLVYEVRKLERTSVLGYDEIRAMLDVEAERELTGCTGEESSCLAEVANALGADIVVVGALTRVGDTHVISLKSIVQDKAQALGTFNKVVAAGSGEELLAEVGSAVAELFPQTTLRPGQVRGVSKDLARRLSPPPLPTPLTLGVGAVGVALFVGAGVSALVQQQTYANYVDLAEASRTDPTSGALVVETGARAVLAEQVGWGLLAGGAAMAVITAALVPFTDFDNVRALDEVQP
jgi:hypothetical protein